jgi:hypothetical protein
MTAMSTGHEGPKRASPLQVAKAVFSAFFGVRRRDDHEALKVTPVQLIIAGIIGAALFVATLLLVVNFILSRVGASA